MDKSLTRNVLGLFLDHPSRGIVIIIKINIIFIIIFIIIIIIIIISCYWIYYWFVTPASGRGTTEINEPQSCSHSDEHSLCLEASNTLRNQGWGVWPSDYDTIVPHALNIQAKWLSVDWNEK